MMEILAQMWSFLGLLTVLQNVLPSQLLALLQSWWETLQDTLSPYSYFEIPEFNGYCGVDVNDLYRQVQLYLNSLDSSVTSRRVTLTRAKNACRISFMVAPNHTMEDSFNGHRLWWTHHVDTVQESLEEKRSFCLKLAKRDRKNLLPEYLAAISARAEEFERVSRDRRLYTNNGHGAYESGWASVPFRHPATFDTLALDPKLREELTTDLTAFANGRDFYNRVGRSWKRGYLLYGPPGTGKSSLIAAMANFLHYDVYDLELTKVADNSELRALLIQTTNKSIIVIEDIDCSLDLTDRLAKTTSTKRSPDNRRGVHSSNSDGDDSRVTLSGLLNFTDGLWSCCGEERIIVFTTNHRDNVDSALIRSGRMDMHVLLGTCGFHAFKSLAFNYLAVEEHELFPVVESSIQAGGSLTPAEISEILIKNREDVNGAVRAVISALQMSIMREERDLDEGSLGSEVMVKMENIDGLLGSSENSDFLPGILAGNRKKRSTWQKKVRFLVRLKRLTRTDSGKSEDFYGKPASLQL